VEEANDGGFLMFQRGNKKMPQTRTKNERGFFSTKHNEEKEKNDEYPDEMEKTGDH